MCTRQRFARRLRCAALLALLLAGGGCRYSRLLALKGQLARFDDFVEVRQDGGLTFVFRRPLVRPADIRSLTGITPTAVRDAAPREEWDYVYASETPAGPDAAPPVSYSVRLGFENGKLADFTWLATNVSAAARDLIVSAAQSLGHARFAPSELRTRWAFPTGGDASMSLLSPDSVRRLLGPELGRAESGSETTLEYRFRLLAPEGNAKDEDRFVRARLTFSSDSQRLRRAFLTAGKIRFAADVTEEASASPPSL
jgi:hypothetical protein